MYMNSNKMRVFRKQQGLTLLELSKKTGLSVRLFMSFRKGV